MPAVLSPASVSLSRAPRLFFAASVGIAASVTGFGAFSARATPKPLPKSSPVKKAAKASAKGPIVKAIPVRKPIKPAPPIARNSQALASRGAPFTPAAPVPIIRVSAAVATAGALSTGGDSAMVELVGSGKGRINYEANVVKAVGLGALPPPTLSRSRAQDVLAARHAALADALRTLGMAVNQVRVSSDSRVQNYVLQSDEIRLRVRALVQASQVVEEKYLPVPGVFRVVVQTPLTGPNSLSEAVGVGGENPPSKKATLAADRRATPEVEASPVSPDPFAPGSPAPERARYTSLIVDCRGLHIQACMSPRVFQKCGDEVYGTMHVSPDYVIETGIAAFPRSMKDALRTARTGERPLIVRANYVKDENRFYPVVSDRDAETIFAADKDSHFFARTAVILLLDPTDR